jgi:SAM-dependent methyltransferase
VARWRERRYHLFMELCDVQPEETILDIGAGAGRTLARYNKTNPIVAVDLEWPDYNPNWLDQANVRFVQADGADLPFAESEFPVAFSNAVIHLVPKAKQPAFAAEVRRVSQRYFVQTHNKWFPVEPSRYRIPLVHFLPGRALRWLARHVAMGDWESINFLPARKLRRLFPDAEIHRERVFGLTKSLMVVRREQSAQD